MTALPVLAQLVLRVAPARDREVLLGDLLEEHAERERSGRAAAGRWLVSQLARSLAPWLGQRWSAFDLQPALAAALAASVASAVGGRVGEALFRYVLELVPLRAAHAPSFGWIVGSACMRGVFAVGAAAATFRSFAPRTGSRT